MSSLGSIITKSAGLPKRLYIFGGPGEGKSSLVSKAAKVIFISTRGEELDALADSGQIGDTARFPVAENYEDVRRYIADLKKEAHEYKTLVIDTANGVERMIDQHVCNRDFGGDWGEKGFLSFGKGEKLAGKEWQVFLQDLDSLRLGDKKMGIILLGHSQIRTKNNPVGADYDEIVPLLGKEKFASTFAWVDAMLLLHTEVIVDKDKKDKKGKAASANTKMLYCSAGAGYVAKNQLGLPQEIELGSNAKESWDIFVSELKKGKK